MSTALWPTHRWDRRWWILAASVGLLALAASFNGVWNEFVYDDLFVVATNGYVHDLRQAWTLFFLPYWPVEYGGDGYRPLTLLAFTLQWTAAQGAPMVFHAVTIALYALSAMAVFWLASLLLEPVFGWICAALFAVHPVHVESVANVVGQAEVWAGLLLFLATASYIEARRKGRLTERRQMVLGSMYLAGCLFKEHAVMLPVVLLAAELLVVGDETPIRTRLSHLGRFYLSLLSLGALFVIFRYLVIGKGLAGFAPFLPFYTMKVGYIDRVLTMLGVAPEWIRLLVWPATLTTEYGPPQYPIARGLAIGQLPGLLIIVGTIGVGIAAARRAPLLSFGIAWLVITLLPSSNFLLSSGILLSERTLFTPSLGILLIVCAATAPVMRLLDRPVYRIAALATLGSILWAGIARSVVRTAAWRTNLTLFTAAISDSPDTYRAHYMLGATLMDQGLQASGEREYLQAMAMFPDDPFVPFNLGQEYFRAGLYDDANRMFTRAIELFAPLQDAGARLAVTAALLGNYPEAARYARLSLEQGRGDSTTMVAILNAASLDEKSKKRLAERMAKQTTKVIAR